MAAGRRHADGQTPGPRRARGPGRRPGRADTRGEIVDAARAHFAAHGYDGTTLRAVARAAGVDPALVHHYFAGKEQLFVAAMALPFDPAEALPAVFDGCTGPEEAAERLVRFFFSVWGTEASRAPLLALLRSATGGPTGAALLRSFVEQALLARIVERMPPAPDRTLRVTLAASHLVGTALLRYVVGVEPLASATEEEVIALVTPTIRTCLAPSQRDAG